MSRKYWSKRRNFIYKKTISIQCQYLISQINLHISKNKIIDKIHKLGLNSKKSRGYFMDAGRRCIVTSTF